MFAVFTDHKVYVHGTMATPFVLLDALMKQGKSAKLKNVQLIHLHLEGKCDWNGPEYEGKLILFFVQGTIYLQVS